MEFNAKVANLYSLTRFDPLSIASLLALSVEICMLYAISFDSAVFH